MHSGLKIVKVNFFSSVLLLQGICYLIEHGFLEWRAESVAEFLYKEEGLNKTAIGNFLGERYMEKTREQVWRRDEKTGSSLDYKEEIKIQKSAHLLRNDNQQTIKTIKM